MNIVYKIIKVTVERLQTNYNVIERHKVNWTLYCVSHGWTLISNNNSMYCKIVIKLLNGMNGFLFMLFTYTTILSEILANILIIRVEKNKTFKDEWYEYLRV